MINQSVKKLVNYAVSCSLIEERDRVWATNRLLEILKIDSYKDEEVCSDCGLEEILGELLDYAVQNGLISDDVTSRDLFDTKLMGAITPPPSVITDKFYALYEQSPERATDFYYDFSCNTDYIRRYRIKRDLKWKADSEYGELDITVNLSKPEKTPEEIAKAKLMGKSEYPKCLLCPENEGYAGRMNHPARQNHRIIPLTVAGEAWGLQYSPYVYYNEHCILFNQKHTPMTIEKATFEKLLDFIALFPHYFIGSNADLPIVGGSILAHEHFQGGHYTFAMEKAQVEKSFKINGFDDVDCGIVKWPMSVIRLNSENRKSLVELADRILTKWRAYSDEKCFIFAETDGEKHNTITPIARMRNNRFELDLVLRNNITTDEYPLGVFHPHSELHNIKKENIGLIEVMGLAVLPSRLKNEMKKLEEAILSGSDIRADKDIEKHAEWFETFKDNYSFTKENTNEILQKEIGKVFAKVLEHAGVYKRTNDGMEGFERFIAEI